MTEMTEMNTPLRKITPTNFLLRMVIFLVITGFVLFILWRPVMGAFQANPWLNGLIVVVLILGILLSLVQVWRLVPEVRWLNDIDSGEPLQSMSMPVLLSAIAFALRDGITQTSLSSNSLRSLLDSVAVRLDESRELLRYMVSLLVFLGLLGTFWGLTLTITSVGDTINSLNVGGGDITALFEELKAGLQSPLSGMAVAFSSSLFGLAGSLILGYMDLQTGQAQNRFYLYVEDWLSSITDMSDKSAGGATGNAITNEDIDRIVNAINANSKNTRDTISAVVSLAEGVHDLTQQVRENQSILQDYMESNGLQQNYILEKLSKSSDDK